MDQIARSQKQIGAILHRHRHAKHLTQGDLAQLAGVRQATISGIESGHPGTKLATLFDILAALNLEIEIKPRSRATPTDLEDLLG